MTKTGNVADDDEKIEEVVLQLFRHFAVSADEQG